MGTLGDGDRRHAAVRWRWVLLLYLPVIVFYAAHFASSLGDEDVVPTGFVQYDQPYYMANARQYLDGETNGVAYSLPFSSLEHPAPIYFQPQTLVLGILWRITGADPGVLFVLFGLVFGLLCVRQCLLVLEHALPQHSRQSPILALLFLWGGGLFFVAGLTYGLLHGDDLSGAVESAFRFDPANGWWFLNLGRNLVYPLEVYYHFLFFSIVLALIGKRFAGATACAALLAISHPFTGLATLLMLVAWSATERWLVRDPAQPKWFLPAIALLLGLAAAYYGWYLPCDPEHAVLMEQWKLAWNEDILATVLAYSAVGLFAIARLRIASFIRSPFQRLLVIWACVWFALEKHDLFMDPVQPLHFTRGYTWCALLLIGAPALSSFLQRTRKPIAIGALVLACTVMLADNAAWMTLRARDNLMGSGETVTITREQHELFAWLSSEVPPNELLVTDDPMTAYLALVYTPHRAYFSHHSNTPDARARQRVVEASFAGLIADALLEQEHIAIVSSASFAHAAHATLLRRSGKWSMYRVAVRGS